MQNRLLTVTLVLCAVLLVIGLLPVHGEEAVYDTVVRLHVLANSDSEEDQALKLKVRDAVLAATEPMLVGCEAQEDAKAGKKSGSTGVDRECRDRERGLLLPRSRDAG